MKNILTITLLFFIAFAFAQSPEEKEVGDFNEVKVFDLIEINLIPSSTNKVVISGEDVDDVEVINKNGKLKIRMKFDRIFDGDNTFVEVHYKELMIIDANEGSQIVSDGLIKQNYLELRAQEGGKIKVGLQVEKLDVRAVTGGIIEATGAVKNQNVVLNTGGIYEGERLETEQTEVKVSAGGEAAVKASVLADAKVRAGGYIEIYGNPETIKKDKVFGGKIKVK